MNEGGKERREKIKLISLINSDTNVLIKTSNWAKYCIKNNTSQHSRIIPGI